jgi:hypothetical protein
MRSYWIALALVAALGLFSAAVPGQAATISYSLTLCEDMSVLQHPNNSIVAENAALKTQFVLMNERTMPYIELRNTSDDDALITQLTMSIGDASKNFDWASLVQASPGVTFTVQAPDAVAGSVKTDLLSIKFTGFSPDDFVRFRVGLSPDLVVANPVMDYRKVLFQMNGSDASHNSIVNVQFSDSEGTAVLTQQLPNFPNDNMFTATNLDVLTTSCGLDSVMPFTATGSGTIPPVPEPGSIILLGMGLLGLSLWPYGRRRRAPQIARPAIDRPRDLRCF